MNLTDYKLHIASADRAADLHEIRGLAQLDGQLNADEKRAVGEAVNKKFATMNRLAVGKPKARWS